MKWKKSGREQIPCRIPFAFAQTSFFVYAYALCSAIARFGPEQQRNAPDCAKRNQRVNHAAEDTPLPAKKPSYCIELKNADETPIESPNDGKKQCNFINQDLFLLAYRLIHF
jgi:hypothetical protein